VSTKSRTLVVVVAIAAIGALLFLTGKDAPTTGLRAGFDAEFLTRPDGYKGLSEQYGFKFVSAPIQMDPGLMYRAVADGAVDVIDGFATDGRIPAYGLVVLKDNQGFFPPYYAAPLVRQETLKKFPELKEVLNGLAWKLTDVTMQGLSYQVDEKGRKASEVAREFLVEQGLIEADAEAGEGSSGASVTVGSKHFTEQEILGEIMSCLIECRSDMSVVRKLNLGGTMICFTALKAGDLDLYAEYTGTGLVNILKQEVIADPQAAYGRVQQEFGKRYELVWLKPFGFNNTYTLTMRHQHAKELGIVTITDLARHINKGPK